MLDLKKFKENLIDSQIWRSMFPVGTWKNTAEDRADHIRGNVWLHLHPARIHQRALRLTYTWGLGGLAFGLFMVLTVTGLLLMFYYRPTVELAYRDMEDLEFAVSFGIFLRNMHRWSAHAMVLVAILHMLRVFLTAAYKAPREFNWGVGVVLLTLTFLLSFTGYLLPWDQLALWAVTLGTDLAGATPFLGADGPFSSLLGIGMKNDLRFVLLGGTTVGGATLLRFYVLHCVVLPFIAGIFMIVHFWRIRKDGFSAAPLPGDVQNNKWDVWPHLVVREYIAALLMMIVLVAWSLLQNAPLKELADATVTPNPSKAPWYLLGIQELLVYFDPWLAGVALPTLMVFGLLAIPYLDHNRTSGLGYYSVKERPFANSIFLFGFTFWFILIGIGLFLRGPNWSWYWPWENWAVYKAPPPTSWNLILVDIEEKVSLFFGSMAVPGLKITGIGGVLTGLATGGVVLGGYFYAGLVLPLKVKRKISLKTAMVTSFVASFLVTGLSKAAHVAFSRFDFVGLNIANFSVTQMVVLAALVFVFLMFGFFLPQHYLHANRLTPLRYIVTMLLLLMMLGIVLKMAARLAFNVQYIFSLPTFNFNI